MRKLNDVSKKLIDKIKEKFSIEKIAKRNNLQSVFNKIIMIAVIIFVLFTTVSYNIFRYSSNNQNKIYEDGFLASTYANKINDDILNIKISSIMYSSTYDRETAEKLKVYGKDIDDHIEKYKSLHNLADEEKKIIDELIKSNAIYSDKIKNMINDIDKSKIVQDDEIRGIILLGDTRVELSKKLIDYANNYADMLNSQNKQMKSMVMYIIIIINAAMIALFILMIFIVTKISEKAEYYAFYSSVTGLPNKSLALNTIAKDIRKLYRDKSAILISLDIDNFKAVNDTLGHNYGDKLLKQAAKRFKRAMHIHDSVYHMGGDEFLFVINSVYNKEQAEFMVKKIQNVFKEPFYIGGKKIDYVTASLGIATINQDGNHFETLYNNADDAMYEAKRLGRNRYMFYEEQMYSNVYEKIVKKKEITEGIKNGEFKVFYQPKVSSEEMFLGAEALVRWIKEDKIIPPSEFIEFSEEEGLIKYIGEAVVIEVCKSVIKWINRGYKDFRIAINLSAEQLMDNELCEKLLKIIKDFNVPFEYIEFEVTESAIMKDLNIAISNIKKIKSYGIKVSLDDFGTGYSSLNYFKKLQVDAVKIDKSFIDTLVFDDATNVMVDAIIKMCHYFGYQIVAEGVENREQIECLKDLNCDIFQGYYFGKPMKEDDFENKFLFA